MARAARYTVALADPVQRLIRGIQSPTHMHGSTRPDASAALSQFDITVLSLLVPTPGPRCAQTATAASAACGQWDANTKCVHRPPKDHTRSAGNHHPKCSTVRRRSARPPRVRRACPDLSILPLAACRTSRREFPPPPHSAEPPPPEALSVLHRVRHAVRGDGGLARRL